MATSIQSTGNSEGDDGGRSSKISNLSNWVNQQLDFVEESFQEAKRRVDQVFIQINEARQEFNKLQQQQQEQRMDIETELDELKKTVGKLKSRIPFNLITVDVQPHPNVNWHPRPNPRKQQLPQPIITIKQPPAGDGLLTDSLKIPTSFYEFLAMRYISVFPENTIIKKSLMLHWGNTNWIGLVEPGYTAAEIINNLVSKGLIELVYKECSRSVCGYKVHPSVRARYSEDQPPPGRARYLVNSIEDEEYIIYDGSAEFSAMKSLVFLHLGKWRRSSAQHIEMVEPDLFFKDIKHMDRLRYISFRDISMIKELPEIITKLTNLEVLDLKYCHNLEAIPTDIGNLWYSLTHLDMSECYFLDHMPVSLSNLSNLKVLKGFVVGETTTQEECCTLQDLAPLRYLLKLNIYTAVRSFPSVDQLTALERLRALRSLTISWGGCQLKSTILLERVATCEPEPVALVKDFSFRLEKLDLQCVPETVTRDWLRPSNFKKLEKLYLRGGQFNDLGRPGQEQDQWNVEILRLRYLSKLQMDWDELEHRFPKLVSLEKVQCPNLTSFPCDDESGLWINITKTPLATYI